MGKIPKGMSEGNDDNPFDESHLNRSRSETKTIHQILKHVKAIVQQELTFII